MLLHCPSWRRGGRLRGFWLRAFIAAQSLHFALYQWLGLGLSSALRGLHLLMGLGACLFYISSLYFLWLQQRASAPAAPGYRVVVLWRLSAGIRVGPVAGLGPNLSLIFRCELLCRHIWAQGTPLRRSPITSPITM